MFLWIVAVFGLVFGILFLFSPGAVIKIVKFSNKVLVNPDEAVTKFRVAFGICLIIIGLSSIFVLVRFVK